MLKTLKASDSIVDNTESGPEPGQTWSTFHPTVIVPSSGSPPDTRAGLSASYLTAEDRGECCDLTHPTTAKNLTDLTK